jgi:AcrR family transcriptional regulator
MTDEKPEGHNQKDETFFSICNAVLKMEVNKGNLRWTISDISRESGVTRSLIYYYFGKEKSVILNEAHRFMLEFFFGSEEHRSLPLTERLETILDLIVKMPYLYVLFFLEKNTNSETGQLIEKAEEGLMKIYKEDYPDLKMEDLQLIYTMILGGIGSKKMSKEQISYMFGKIFPPDAQSTQP